jgi:uncharacterized membrane protein YcaP (DUF421 family)
VLVHNGAVNNPVMAKERITMHELHSAIRQMGLMDLAQVRVALLENTGRINVIPMRGEGGMHPAPPQPFPGSAS